MTGVPPSGSGRSAEPEPGSTVSAVPASVPNASGCGLAVAVTASAFAAIWVMGLWMNPTTRDWADSLPFGLGMPVFVAIGMGLTVLAAAAPIAIYVLIASAIAARGEQS